MGKNGAAQQPSFEQRKRTFLGKDDKSSAGGIDAHAREVCAVVNERADSFTTSSCSGRAFLWRGDGMKSTSNFVRYRITHELVEEARPYFDLESLHSEVVDGAWDGIQRTREKASAASRSPSGCLSGLGRLLCGGKGPAAGKKGEDPVVWLRFEPFILHICCRDFEAAAVVGAAARTVFKNVGVSSWSEGKVMLAIWGDEGLEMALSGPKGQTLFKGEEAWLKEEVNTRHLRNWAKIDRFTEALRACPVASAQEGEQSAPSRAGPRRYDVVGDVAVLSQLPPEAEREEVGKAILDENKKLRIVAARGGGLQSEHRSPGSLEVLAGPERTPLLTTHLEFGVRIVVDLSAVFFSPKMGPERQRLCEAVQPGERALVAFAGCCPEALQLAAKTQASRVTAVELNPAAVRCARRSLELLAKQSAERAGCVEILEGDVVEVAKGIEKGSLHRLLAPRPKGKTEEEDDAIAEAFLTALLPLLRPGGVCHWYDFVADWEFPECERSKARIEAACGKLGRRCRVLRCAAANNKPVAERQYRTVLDFSVE